MGYINFNEVYDKVRMMHADSPEQPLLSIVIPAYKEAKRLPESLVKIQSFLRAYPLPVEVSVIVEKSPDYTWEIGSQLVEGDPQISVIDNKVKMGKG